MFSGIVECMGIITQLKYDNSCVAIRFRPQQLMSDIKLGDSIAVNGVCLTITNVTGDEFDVTIVPESLRCSNLGGLNVGDWINLERSLPNNARNSGHYVQGHVDGVGIIEDIVADGAATLFTVALPDNLAQYVAQKGYIAIDGASLTITEIIENAQETKIKLSLIPYTKQHTIVSKYTIGSKVNIEVDILSKYVARLINRATHVNTH